MVQLVCGVVWHRIKTDIKICNGLGVSSTVVSSGVIVVYHAILSFSLTCVK